MLNPWCAPSHTANNKLTHGNFMRSATRLRNTAISCCQKTLRSSTAASLLDKALAGSLCKIQVMGQEIQWLSRSYALFSHPQAKPPHLSGNNMGGAANKQKSENQGTTAIFRNLKGTFHKNNENNFSGSMAPPSMGWPQALAKRKRMRHWPL